VSVKATRTPRGFLSEIGIPRIAVVGAVVILALAIQSALLPQATLLGVIPQLVLLVVVTLAYLDGERVGIVTGFAGGLLADLQLPDSILGLTALIYTLIGYGVGTIRQYAPSESVWTPVLFVAASSAIAEVAYASLSIMLGQTWVGFGFTLKVVALVVLYNTLLTPFVFPLVRRVADRFRPDKVYRW
jgi:rod shape-determining protein MreD